jgi:hypothetical protein
MKGATANSNPQAMAATRFNPSVGIHYTVAGTDGVATAAGTGTVATVDGVPPNVGYGAVSWFAEPGPNVTILDGCAYLPTSAMKVHEYVKTSIRHFRRAASLAFTNRKTTEPPPPGYQPGNFGLWLPDDMEVPHPGDVDFEFVCEPSPTGKALGVQTVSVVVKSEWLAPGPQSKKSRRAMRKALGRAVSLATRAVFRLLRSFITYFVRLDGLHRLREFVCKQRPWHLLHGAHPPRFSALIQSPVFRPIDLPGATA